jgi:hypothetical protein
MTGSEKKIELIFQTVLFPEFVYSSDVIDPLVLTEFLLKIKWAGRWWLMPVILGKQEAEIRRIMI